MKSALLAVLLLGFVSLFSVGCGDDREEFVATNNNGGTGNLVFRFQQAQTVDTVPAGTTSLAFSLHSGSPASTANLVEVRGPIAFAPVITLTNVPTNVNTVVVTAFGANGQPLGALSGTNITVVAGGSTDVDLGSLTAITFDAITFTPDPITLTTNGAGVQGVVTGSFSNGSTVTLPINNTSTSFTFATSNVANVSSTGLFTSNRSGVNSSVTVAYTLAGVTRSDTFQVNVADFQIQALGSTTLPTTGTYNAGFLASAVRSNGQVLGNVTPNTTFTISPAVAGANITSNGVITLNGATPGTLNVVGTWADSFSGLTFTDTVPFTVSNPQ